MPHVILEASANIKVNTDILTTIHKILAEQLPTQLESCKSRIIRHNDYVVGDGAVANAFVHLTISVMPGRSQELLAAVAGKIMLALKEYFQQPELNLQITIAIADLPAVYHKYEENGGSDGTRTRDL